MKLYYAPGTCAVACWIALEWAGADYEVEKVQLGTDEYRKINPLGAVPALDIGEGIVRGELAAILRYVLHKYPEKIWELMKVPKTSSNSTKSWLL